MRWRKKLKPNRKALAEKLRLFYSKNSRKSGIYIIFI